MKYGANIMVVRDENVLGLLDVLKRPFRNSKFRDRVDHGRGPFNWLYLRCSRSELVKGLNRKANSLFIRLEPCSRKTLRAQALKEIRGLRRCQSVECGVILHRDRNAAINIATNFRRLYSGQPLPRQATAADIKLVTALQALD